MMRFVWITLFFTSTLLSFQTFPCFSVLVADIDTVEFSHTIRRPEVKLPSGKEDPFSKKKSRENITFLNHLRVVFFDTEAQQFVGYLGKFPGIVYYLSIPQGETCSPKPIIFPDWFKIKYSYDNGKMSVSVDLSSFKPKEAGCVIRWNGTCLSPENLSQVDLSASGVSDETRPELKSVFVSLKKGESFPSTQYKSSQAIQEFFSLYSERIKTRNQSLTSRYIFFESNNASHKIITQLFIDKPDKRNIGELAADITMQWLGFMKKDGKYNEGSDNGFDGAYVRKDLLFLSDSKFFTDTPSLKTVLNKDLFATLENRLANMETKGSELQKATAQFIRERFSTHLKDIYLLPYVVILDGAIKALAKQYTVVQQEISPIKKQKIKNEKAPDSEEEENIETKARTLFESSGLEAVAYIKLLMTTLGVDQEYKLVKRTS